MVCRDMHYTAKQKTINSNTNTTHSRPPQLPSLAPRPDNGNPLPQLRHRIHPLTTAGRQHPRPRALLQHPHRTRRPETAAALVHQCRPTHWISSSWGWSCWLRIRRFGTRLGKKALVPARDGDYHHQLGMGGCVGA
jgi:hypothetical protein